MVNYRVHMEPFFRQHYMSHRAFSPLSINYTSRDHPNSLVDELRPVFIAGTRPAFTGSARKASEKIHAKKA